MKYFSFSCLSSISFLLTAAMLLTLSGCGGSDTIDRNKYEAAKSDDDSKNSSTKKEKQDEGNIETARSSGVDGNLSNPRTSAKENEDPSIDNPKSKENEVDPITKSIPEEEKGKGENPESALSNEPKTFDPAPETDKWIVPTSGLNDVLVFMDRLERNLQALGKEPQKNRIALIQIHRARIKAAEEIMERPELLERGTQTKLDALILMSRLGEPQMEQLALEYSQTVKDFENQAVADYGRLFILSVELREALKSQKKEDINAFLIGLEELVAKRPDSLKNYGVVNQFISQLFRAQMRETAIEGMKVMINGYRDTKTSEIATGIERTKEQLFLRENKFDLAVEGILQNRDEESVKKYMEVAKVVLDRPKLTKNTFAEVYRNGVLIEGLHMYDKARELFQLIKDAFKDQADAKLASEVTVICDKSLRRIDLLGKKLVVEGLPLSATEALDWSLFEDKVVILTFWQSDSAACAGTLQHLNEFIKANDDKDLELIGVNIDPDPKTTVLRLRGRAPDWTVVFTDDLNQTGFQTPMAIKCGVASVPYTLLIDRDGTVADLRLFGDDLEQRVANLLDEEVEGRLGKVKPDSQREQQNEKEENGKVESTEESGESKSITEVTN